jgi:hydrogenase nickel incorporation protein HypA/HybF
VRELPCASDVRSRGHVEQRRVTRAQIWLRARTLVRRMHELALVESMIDAVNEQLGDEDVALVQLAIGELAGVSSDALVACFELCVAGTRLAGAQLDIVEVAGRARCRACGDEAAMPRLAQPCDRCGSFDRAITAGQDLRLVGVELREAGAKREERSHV